MDIIQAVALSLLQGLTEFLPISSSAHLILMPVLFGWKDQGLAFDVAVHVGTLTAVVTYYRQDLYVMLRDWLASLSGGKPSENARLGWFVGVGTVPVGLFGFFMPEPIETALRSPKIIAGATMAFALLIWWAEKRAEESRDRITLTDALVVGFFQAVALIPGTSRSGITITAGLLTGLTREQAARFSFLLSIPVIALAGLLKTVELVRSSAPVPWDMMAVGAVLSAIIAYLTIGWFLRLLDRFGLMPFVWYRLLLGLFLFAVFI
ncbi:MAG: undecaprenyl-diphosphate phosphatase [Gammaproteobacteria bacterium]